MKRVMTNLSKILSLENVLLDLEVSSKKRAFEQAGLIFENNCGIARSTVSDNLFARERLGSTGLGHGVAVPHGRIKGSKSLKSPLAAFVRLAEPIPFESPDGQAGQPAVLPADPGPRHPAAPGDPVRDRRNVLRRSRAHRAGHRPRIRARYTERIINWQPSLQAGWVKLRSSPTYAPDPAAPSIQGCTTTIATACSSAGSPASPAANA
jgi:PTS system nitrogen regulatory IIA component